MNKILSLALIASIASLTVAQGQIVISGFLANPASNDTNNEYVQLVATSTIDFSINNYSVVFANNGTANTSGWVAGAGITYGFNITSGTVSIGDVFYVGGNSRLIDGAGSTSISSANWIKTLDNTQSGDGFGNGQATSGVFGNGGTNADAVGVFSGLTSSLTSSTVPVDAIFFGTSVWGALVNSGADGYQLPVNDLYSGGKLQSTSLLFPDAGSNAYNKATGTYNIATASWDVARTGSLITLSSSSTLTDISTGITLVPEPATYAFIAGALVLGIALYRRNRA